MAVYPTEDMKGFNPGIPDTQDTRWDIARGTGTPRLTSAKAGAIKDIGDIAVDALKVADAYNKNTLTDQITAQVDAKRDAETQKLETAYATVRDQAGFQPIPGAAGALPTDRFNILSTDKTKPIPGELKNLPGTLGDLGSAKASGKYSPTYLEMQYAALAKDFRSRYPSYREYIDNEFKRLTGSDPANAVIAAMRSDLNTFIGNKQAEKQKVSAKLLSAVEEGIPGADKVWANHQHGLITDDEAVAQLGTFRAQRYQWDNNAAAVKDLNNSQALESNFARSVVPAELARIANRNIDTLMVQFRDKEGNPAGSPVNVRKVIEDASKPGATPLNETQWQQIGEALKQNSVTAEREMRALMDQIPKDSAGKNTSTRSWGVMLGEDLEKHIATAKNIYAMYDAAVNNPNSGLANSAANWTKTAGDEALKGLINIDKTIAIHAAAAKISPEFVSQLIRRGLDLPTLEKKAIDGLVTEQAFGKNWNLFQTQTGDKGVAVPPPNPAPVTPTESLNKAEKMGLSDKAKNIILHAVDWITAKTTPEPNQKDLAEAAFDPRNRDFLTLLNDDRITNGRTIEGKQTAFQMYTKPDMTAKVWSFGDPKLWGDYKAWAENSAFNVLYPQEIKKLSETSVTPGYRVTYDTTSQRFELRGKFTNVLGYPNQSSDTAARASLERINMMTHNLGEIAKQEGKDPNEYVLKMMLMTNPVAASLKVDTKGLPTELIEAVRKAYEQASSDTEKPAGESNEGKGTKRPTKVKQ